MEGWGSWSSKKQSVFQSTRIGHVVRPIEYAPDDWQLDMGGPTFELPGRRYHLFRGMLRDALRIGDWTTADWFNIQSPNLIWPADQAWCVATEIDSTLVGGSDELIADLVAWSTLEAFNIDPDAPYDDQINT